MNTRPHREYNPAMHGTQSASDIQNQIDFMRAMYQRRGSITRRPLRDHATLIYSVTAGIAIILTAILFASI